MDFAERLKEYLESLESTPSTIGMGKYNEDDDYSVAIIITPSSYSRYIKGKIYPFNFQISVHSKNNYLAYVKSQEINSSLENLNKQSIVSKNNSFALISMQCTTTPNYVSETSKGILYAGLYTAEIYII